MWFNPYAKLAEIMGHSHNKLRRGGGYLNKSCHGQQSARPQHVTKAGQARRNAPDA